MHHPGHFGLISGRRPSRGHVLYAEITPASPLLYWVGFTRRGWRRFVPFANGRSWLEPHIRWWYEIHSTYLSYPYEDGGSGGAFSLAGCLNKAEDALEMLEEKFMADIREVEDEDNS
jgi:hypothetical protein